MMFWSCFEFLCRGRCCLALPGVGLGLGLGLLHQYPFCLPHWGVGLLLRQLGRARCLGYRLLPRWVDLG